MLTKNQIHSLPKGEYKNYQLGQLFTNQGKKEREIVLPIDKEGRVDFKKGILLKKMRLNKTQYRSYVN